MRKMFRAALGFLILATIFPGSTAHAATCAGATAGGEWRSYGHDLTNSRNQPEETKIGASNVADLEGAWGVTASSLGGLGGSFQSTVAVAGGCTFVTTSSGSIAAINADTGELLWHVQQSPVQALAGIFAPAVVDGIVYVTVGQATVPYVLALDASTGTEIWRTYLYQQLLDGEPTYLSSIASVVYFDGLLFVPMTGSDLLTFSHPSYYILRAFDGAILKKTNVIPQEDWINLYAGGAIWTTGAVDTQSKYIYVGTGNPYNKRKEHPHTNAILKIDVDQKRDATFGKIVGHYKGDPDFTPSAYFTTECETLAEAFVAGFSTFCGQLDVDFGASPNLFVNSEGRKVLGELQKSCTYHAIDAETMELIWKHSNPDFAGANNCAGTSAYDDHAVYVAESDGKMYAFDKDDGTVMWSTPFTIEGAHYQPVTVANGVVYTLTGDGHLIAMDNQDGTTIVDEPITDGAGNTCQATSAGGITIARNTVYIACDSGSGGSGIVFAYRLP